ncbi:dihydrolipoyl dehydrogenase, partial [Candidatus Bathyarchaeota archaeon]
EQAKGEGFKVAVGRFPYLFNGRALTRGETQGLVKVVADLQTGRLLGIHIFGAEASELIAEATLALKMGCRVEDLASTIHAHPTLSEALREAALEIQGKKLHKPREG